MAPLRLLVDQPPLRRLRLVVVAYVPRLRATSTRSSLISSWADRVAAARRRGGRCQVGAAVWPAVPCPGGRGRAPGGGHGFEVPG